MARKKRQPRKPRNITVLGIIKRGGKGIHAGQSTADLREAKAPIIDLDDYVRSIEPDAIIQASTQYVELPDPNWED
jgi:hypothetical protein